MMLISFLKRFMGLSHRRTTEEYQRDLLNYLSNHPHTSPGTIIKHFYPTEPHDLVLREVLQAAQILVNKGELTASRNGKRIEPIYGNETIVLQIKPRQAQ